MSKYNIQKSVVATCALSRLNSGGGADASSVLKELRGRQSVLNALRSNTDIVKWKQPISENVFPLATTLSDNLHLPDVTLRWQYYANPIHNHYRNHRKSSSYITKFTSRFHNYGTKANPIQPVAKPNRRLYRVRAESKDGWHTEWVYLWIKTNVGRTTRAFKVLA